MENHTLFSILSSFHGVEGEEDGLIPQFREIARYLLSGGYFIINKTRKIYLTDIEFYYHEEGSEGKKVKDPIMYHTYDHEKNTKFVKENNKLPYFPLCSLNTHVSGIDITFENENQQYRASFLIRGYKRDGKKKETRSTQIYEDFFMGISLSQDIILEWENEGNLCSPLDIESTVRLRVPAYQKDSQGNYVIDSKGNYMRDFIVKDNKKVFKQCPRKWRFKRINDNRQ